MENIAELFKFQLPKYFDDYYNDFAKVYDRKIDIMTDYEISMIKNATSCEQYIIDSLYETRKIINKSDIYHLAVSYFCYVTILARKPWQNYVHNEDLIKGHEINKHTLCLFIVCKQLAYTLISKKPPVDKNARNIKSFNDYTRGFYNQYGFAGIGSFSWNLQCAAGCMFDFGILTFCPSYFTNEFPIIRKGNEFVTMVISGFGIRKDGSLTHDKKDIIGTTYFKETKDEYIGNIIEKDGTVRPEIKHFSKKEYEPFLMHDAYTCDIHIPPHAKYNVEEIKKSFKEALKFYSSYYPTHKIRAFAGYSWIFAPELKYVLDDNSNILKVNSFFHIIPTLGTYDETCEFIRPNSSLYKKIKKECSGGRKFHYAIMYLPLEEIND